MGFFCVGANVIHNGDTIAVILVNEFEKRKSSLGKMLGIRKALDRTKEPGICQ